MDYKDEMSSNNLSQPSADRVNLSENQDENRKTKNSRALLILFSSLLVATLLISVTYMGLSRPKSVTQTPTIQTVERQSPPVTTVLDLPPLYPGLKWKYTEKKVKDGSYTLKGGTIELEMYRADSEPLNNYPNEFVAYYKQHLSTSNGWTLTGTTAGGHTVDFYSYVKDNQYINFEVWKSYNSSGEISGYSASVEHN